MGGNDNIFRCLVFGCRRGGFARKRRKPFRLRRSRLLLLLTGLSRPYTERAAMPTVAGAPGVWGNAEGGLRNMPRNNPGNLPNGAETTVGMPEARVSEWVA